MKVIVNNIPEEGLNLKFHRDSEWFRNLLPQKERNEFALRGVDVSCLIKRIRENVFIDGALETVVTSNCCRCLDIAQLPVKSSFRYTFVPAQERDGGEEELTPEDLEYGYYQDDVIDLDTIIFEQIMLHIPMRVLCADTCKGLCPHCGNNLNMAKCECRTDVMNEKLAVLKNFKISDNK